MQTHDLINELSKDLKPVRRLAAPVRRWGLWLFLAACLVLLGIATLGALRGNLAARMGDTWFLLESAVAFLVFTSSAAMAFRLSVPGQERYRAARFIPLILIGVWVALLGYRSLELLSQHSLEQQIGHGFGCSKMLIKLSLLPAIFLFWMIKKAAPLQTGWTGALSLISASALGALAIQFMCPSLSAMHVLFWHFLPVLGVGAAGYLLGKILFRW